MKIYSYVPEHNIDDCSYICIIKSTNVEAKYAKAEGRQELDGEVQKQLGVTEVKDKALKVLIDENNKSKIYNDSDTLISSNFVVSFVKNSSNNTANLWNIIVLYNKKDEILSMVYEDEYINTEYVDKIQYTYTIDYDLTGTSVHINIVSYFIEHNQTEWLAEAIVGDDKHTGHNLPSFLGTSSSRVKTTTIMTSIPPDIKSLTDFQSAINQYSDIEYTYEFTRNTLYKNAEECFISMCNMGPVVLYKYSDTKWRVTPYALSKGETFDYPFTMPEGISKIHSLNVVDDMNGIIMDSLEGKYVWINNGDNSGNPQYGPPIKVEESDDYTILIPTFIDLCHCYIRIPNLNRHPAYSYEVKYWKDLTQEDTGYNNTLVVDSHTASDGYSNPSTNSYSESLSGKTTSSTLFENGKESPILALANMMYDGVNTWSDNSGISMSSYKGAMLMYHNLRLMALTYVDTFNKMPYNLVSVVPCDTGLDITLYNNDQTGYDRYFITYYGQRYKIPYECKMTSSNMYYTILGIYNLDGTIQSIIDPTDGKTYALGDNMLAYKYGIPIVRGGS